MYAGSRYCSSHVCARRGDARDARSLFAFYLQIESRASFSERCRYSVRSATSGGSGLRARARVWGRAGPRAGARSRSGWSASGPESHTTLRTLLACLHTHSTDSTRPGLSPEKARCRYICTHYTSMSHVLQCRLHLYTMNLKSLLRERRASVPGTPPKNYPRPPRRDALRPS